MRIVDTNPIPLTMLFNDSDTPLVTLLPVFPTARQLVKAGATAENSRCAPVCGAVKPARGSLQSVFVLNRSR